MEDAGVDDVDINVVVEVEFDVTGDDCKVDVDCVVVRVCVEVVVEEAVVVVAGVVVVLAVVEVVLEVEVVVAAREAVVVMVSAVLEADEETVDAAIAKLIEIDWLSAAHVTPPTPPQFVDLLGRMVATLTPFEHRHGSPLTLML